MGLVQHNVRIVSQHVPPALEEPIINATRVILRESMTLPVTSVVTLFAKHVMVQGRMIVSVALQYTF